MPREKREGVGGVSETEGRAETKGGEGGGSAGGALTRWTVYDVFVSISSDSREKALRDRAAPPSDATSGGAGRSC